MKRDPLAARFVTEDLPRFWTAFKRVDTPDAEEVFGRVSLQPGTAGRRAVRREHLGSAAVRGIVEDAVRDPGRFLAESGYAP